MISLLSLIPLFKNGKNINSTWAENGNIETVVFSTKYLRTDINFFYDEEWIQSFTENNLFIIDSIFIFDIPGNIESKTIINKDKSEETIYYFTEKGDLKINLQKKQIS